MILWKPILGAALALAPAGAAAEPAGHAGVADPIAFMRARYAEYLSGNVRVLALDTYASARLRAHLHAFDEAAGGQEVDSLDFWVGEPGDWSLTGLGLTLEPGPGRTARPSPPASATASAQSSSTSGSCANAAPGIWTRWCDRARAAAAGP